MLNNLIFPINTFYTYYNCIGIIQLNDQLSLSKLFLYSPLFSFICVHFFNLVVSVVFWGYCSQNLFTFSSSFRKNAWRYFNDLKCSQQTSLVQIFRTWFVVLDYVFVDHLFTMKNSIFFCLFLVLITFPNKKNSNIQWCLNQTKWIMIVSNISLTQ